LVGKRLLLVYAQALRAASERITKARLRSINVMIECRSCVRMIEYRRR
jgi:hypothetical protein